MKIYYYYMSSMIHNPRKIRVYICEEISEVVDCYSTLENNRSNMVTPLTLSPLL